MVTDLLARFVVDTGFDELPASAVNSARLSFLDWLGSAYVGCSAEPSRIISSLIGELGGTPEATVIGHGRRNSCLYAAMANAAFSHVVEMDDLDTSSIYHPAAPIIPAALALAERHHKSGAEFIRAIVLAYETSIRIGQAVNPSHYQYWHTTGTVGTFGAAVAAAVLLELNFEQTVSALGSADTQAAGLWEFLTDGAMSKQLHPAKAAMNGILGALLAQRGFTAATKILEGEKGFCRATASEYDLEKIADGLSSGMSTYKISRVSFKWHASCRHTHSAIDATLNLVNEHHLRPEDIDYLTVKIYRGAMELLGKLEANTPYAAKFNLPYCVAMAAVHHSAAPDKFTEEYLRDKKVRALMQRVRLEIDPSLDKSYPEKWPSVVELVTRGGNRLVSRVDYPRGDPENPLSQDELGVKFRALASGKIGQEQIERHIKDSLRLEKIDNMASFL